MSADAVLRALAEPNRRAILRLVRDEPLSVSQIAEHFDITQQAVSLHLKVLRDSGLVRAWQEGQRRLYVVDPDGFESLREFLTDLWPDALGRLEDAVEAAAGSDRRRPATGRHRRRTTA